MSLTTPHGILAWTTVHVKPKIRCTVQKQRDGVQRWKSSLSKWHSHLLRWTEKFLPLPFLFRERLQIFADMLLSLQEHSYTPPLTLSGATGTVIFNCTGQSESKGIEKNRESKAT